MSGFTLNIESRENLRPAMRESLPLPSAELSVEQLIGLRVLHGTATRPPEEQKAAVRLALDAFRRGTYLLVVDGCRRGDLAERLTLTERSEVRFWRLVPLVGG